MPVLFDSFGGLIPKLEPESLPDQAAQTATNCDVSGGLLVPATLPNNRLSMRDENGLLPSDVSSDKTAPVAIR